MTKEISLYKAEVQDGASVPLQVCAVAQEMGLQFLSVQMKLSCCIWSFIAENIKESSDTEAMLYCHFFQFHFASYTHEF